MKKNVCLVIAFVFLLFGAIPVSLAEEAEISLAEEPQAAAVTLSDYTDLLPLIPDEVFAQKVWQSMQDQSSCFFQSYSSVLAGYNATDESGEVQTGVSSGFPISYEFQNIDIALGPGGITFASDSLSTILNQFNGVIYAAGPWANGANAEGQSAVSNIEGIQYLRHAEGFQLRGNNISNLAPLAQGEYWFGEFGRPVYIDIRENALTEIPDILSMRLIPAESYDYDAGSYAIYNLADTYMHYEKQAQSLPADGYLTLDNPITSGGAGFKWKLNTANMDSGETGASLVDGNTSDAIALQNVSNAGTITLAITSSGKSGGRVPFRSVTKYDKAYSEYQAISTRFVCTISDDGTNSDETATPAAKPTATPYTEFAPNASGVLQSQMDKNWYYVKNGVIQTSYTGLQRNSAGWWYIKNGKVDVSFNGVATNEYGTWYVKNGKLDTSVNGVVQAANDKCWYYVVNGKVQTGYTGFQSNSAGTWYIVNGKIDAATNSVIQSPSDKCWYYVYGGKIQTGYTGVQQNSAGWWYIKNGKVDVSFNGVASNSYGMWYIVKGKVDFSANGVIQAANDKCWYFVSGGKVQTNYTGVQQNSAGWWYINKGKIDVSFTGAASNQYGTWWMEKGKLNTSANGVKTDASGKKYTVKNGKVVG